MRHIGGGVLWHESVWCFAALRRGSKHGICAVLPLCDGRRDANHDGYHLCGAVGRIADCLRQKFPFKNYQTYHFNHRQEDLALEIVKHDEQT